MSLKRLIHSCAKVAIPTVGQLPEPLRLPHGSVRGAIAIVVAAAYGYLLLNGDPVPVVLVNAVVVVIAFYFGSRAVSTPPAVPAGQPAPHRPRLVRVLLFLGFAGLTAWFLSRNPSLSGIPAPLLAVLEVLGGYVLGPPLLGAFTVGQTKIASGIASPRSFAMSSRSAH